MVIWMYLVYTSHSCSTNKLDADSDYYGSKNKTDS